MQIKVNLEQMPKSTIKLNIVVPAEEVKNSYEEVLEKLAKEAELPGFRKGMAPKEMVREKADLNKLYGEVVNDLLQASYTQAVTEKDIHPVINPQVEIQNFDPEKDFEYTATVAVRPEVKMGDYRKKLKELQKKKEESVKSTNAEKFAKGEPLSEENHVHLSPNEVVNTLNESAEVEIAEMLIEEETQRMMSRLIGQAETIGLSIEQYLKAQNKTADQLREDYKTAAESTLKAEFVLSHLVKENNIEATDEEIEETAKASGDPKALEQIKNPMEKWYIKSILEKNRLINNLIEEVAHE
jgi:FKBP-type peptidyl-prolyl cis-trans isomerase (trigger factor)